jgi:hypothetical protein
MSKSYLMLRSKLRGMISHQVLNVMAKYHTVDIRVWLAAMRLSSTYQQLMRPVLQDYASLDYRQVRTLMAALADQLPRCIFAHDPIALTAAQTIFSTCELPDLLDWFNLSLFYDATDFTVPTPHQRARLDLTPVTSLSVGSGQTPAPDYATSMLQRASALTTALMSPMTAVGLLVPAVPTETVYWSLTIEHYDAAGELDGQYSTRIQASHHLQGLPLRVHFNQLCDQTTAALTYYTRHLDRYLSTQDLYIDQLPDTLRQCHGQLNLGEYDAGLTLQ